MNLYFLLEGKRTEPKIYPKWLSCLLPNYSQVSTLSEIKENNYFIFSGRGYPSLLNHINNALIDLTKYKNINYLVISVDCDEETPNERILTIKNKINEFKNDLNMENIYIIPQNRCIETWLLGNKKIFTHNPQDTQLVEFISFYNVSDNDPEKMKKYKDYNTTCQFHISYLQKLLNEKNIRYSKTNPSDTAEEYYLEQLIKRVNESNDLRSFKSFLEVIEKFK